MSAVNSGVTAEPGFTYSNQLLFYSRDTAKMTTVKPCRSRDITGS